VTACVPSPLLLSNLETCPRKGFYSRSYEALRLPVKEMVTQAIRIALTAPNEQERPFGEVAGDTVIQLASDRGVDTDLHKTYPTVIHHAALSDLLVSTIRKPNDPPWLLPPPSKCWTSDCYLSPDESTLRRIVLVSYWSDERHYAECRNWYSLGEMAQYELPMQLVVFVIGQQRNGKRLSPWTQGFLHPMNKQLRFRKKSRSTSEVFNDKWEKIYREDHDEISRETWLESMLRDDVLAEVCFRVDIPLPDRLHLLRIRQTTERKLSALHAMKEKPDIQYSTCDRPPCAFKRCCHVLPETEPSEKNGFVHIQTLTEQKEPRSPVLQH
jgi:hypothetical protein